MTIVSEKRFDTIAMPNLPRIYSILFLLVCALVTSVTANAQTSEGLDDKLTSVENTAAPSFDDLKWLNASQQNVDLRGKVILVNFWASWCPPCIEELPSIQRLWASHDRSDFDVVAVNVGEDEPTIKQFLSIFSPKLEVPIAIDPDLETYRAWRVSPLPTTFVVDRKGQIRYSAIGGRDFYSDNIRSIIDRLISE